jgi:hypothetical protein
MRFALRCAAVLLVLIAAACAGDGAQQTLEADHAALSTQISDIRASATVQADRLQITLEQAQTAVRAALVQNQNLVATLVRAGFDPASLEQVTPVSLPTPTATLPVGFSTFVPAATVDTAFSTPAVSEPLTPMPGGDAVLYNAVMAEGVGENDCALVAVGSFAPTIETIYVVAIANNIQPGMKLSSTWFREGQQIVVHDFTPEFAINQNCIWFFIDQTDTEFLPGTYSVQLAINDQPVGPALDFVIRES